LILILITLSSLGGSAFGHSSLESKPAGYTGSMGFSPSGFDPAGLFAAGLSYTAPEPETQEYVGVLGSVSVNSLNVLGDIYSNGSLASGKGVFLQLAASVYSPTAGVYWSVLGVVFNQSSGGLFTFRVVDQVWNETYACVGPGTLDQMSNVSGRGGIVVSFPGCFGTHYEYTTPVLGVVKPPFNLSLDEYIAPSNGAIGLVYNYTLLSSAGSFGGVVDKVTLYPGLKPAQAILRVGGLTQLGFNYGMQVTLSAPLPFEVAELNDTFGELSLTPITQGGVKVFPNQTLNYGIISLSGVEGVSVYPNLSNPNRPEAVFSNGTLHPSSLWPLSTRGEYALTQTKPGGSIVIGANFTYYNPKTSSYTPLPQAQVGVIINGSIYTVVSYNGSIQYAFNPETYGYYTVNLSYPHSLAFGTPRISFVMGVMGLESNITSGSANLTYIEGYSANLSLVPGARILILIPPSGLTLEALGGYQRLGPGVRYGFVGWSEPGGFKLATARIFVSKPIMLTALFGTQYLVNITIPGEQPRIMWVSSGALINLTAPQYIYVEANLERLSFVNWSTGAVGNTSVVVHSPINITANYEVEYKVYLSTPNATLVNTYYTNGSIVKVSVPPTLGGSFLYPNAFQGWSGTVESHSRSLKLIVTRPIVDEAIYAVSYSRVSDLEALLAVAVGALIAYVAQRKRV